MILADNHITIDIDGIRMPLGETEYIPFDAIRKIEVSRELIGDYKRGGIAFLMLGLLSIWFMVGFVFLALGVVGLMVKKYRYRLMVSAYSGTYCIMERERKGPVVSMCRTIEGVLTARKLNRLANTNGQTA